jgi:hypothetical protein
MSVANVVVFIHGVVEDTSPSNHAEQYDAFWEALVKRRPSLATGIDRVVRVEWGHAPLPADSADWPDTHLTNAENNVLAATSYDAITQSPTADDTFLAWEPDFLQRAVVRPLTKPIKNTVMTLGIADAFYYTAPDGERAVRGHVYSTVLGALDDFRDRDRIALHMIGHSQGATIAFDFLFGLIAPESELTDGRPGFLSDEQGDHDAMERFEFWRRQAQQTPPKLVLGSNSSFGSQVGLMMMRKQRLVDRLAKGIRLDPTVIGVPKTADSPKWKIFFDTDDVLGFPARRIFDATGSIHEYEVDSDWNPIESHAKYWQTPSVQSEIADLIDRNLA